MSADDWPVEVDPIFGCWIWSGRVDRKDGRPLVWRGAKPIAAHRYVYEREVGTIKSGMELDHLCRRPHCVNPKHMEPVTREENEKRKSWRVRVKSRTCPNGHSMASAMVTPEGGRLCRQCAGRRDVTVAPKDTTRGTIYVLMGAPGAGKTTWCKEHASGMHVASTEPLRDDKTIDRVAFLDEMRRAAAVEARRGCDIVVDATNIDPRDRARWRALAATERLRPVLIVFDVPLEVLLAAQKGRSHPVSDDVVRSYSRAMEQERAKIAGEGWADVVTVRRC